MPTATALVPHKTSHPYLRIVDFRDGGIDESALMYVPAEVFPAISRYTISPNDIYVSIVGTIGLVGQVPPHLDGANLTENAAKVTDLQSHVSPEYLRYYLQSPEGQRQIRAKTVGSTQPKLALFRIEEIEVPIPSLSEQRQITSLLRLLEARLALLRQTNATLESIAQALFKSWFIDFDPVRAKAEGREPEGMDAATAALFPAEFEESALGLIPKGWSVSSIADLCSRVANGGTPSRSKPSFWTNGTVPWFKTGELFDSHLLHSTEHITSEAVSSTSVKVLPRHAVLMAIYAAPTVGRLGVLTTNGAFNQACTGMVAKPEVGPWFLFQTLFHGRDWFNSRANGAAQQNISKGIVESYQCVRPVSELLRTFNRIAGALYASTERDARQAQVLTELRDTLLPRLISGKLRLPEAQAQVEEAIA